jgi:hypothetical protein
MDLNTILKYFLFFYSHRCLMRHILYCYTIYSNYNIIGVELIIQSQKVMNIFVTKGELD